VTSVEIHGDSVLLRSVDADITLRPLFAARDQVHDIEVTGAGLEEAFLTLTGGVR
jgi:ABC-2 type transport system ATP-binding protein